MKLQNIFEDLLNEATPEQIYKKYYSNIDYKIFLDIIEADPKTKISGNHILRIGPYSKILINIYNTGNLNMEDLPKATDYLEVVYKYNIPLNNNEIKSIGDIYEKVKTKMFVSNQSFNDVFNLLQPDEYKILLNSEKWLLLSPQTERASCYLGINTEWCTTWGKHSLNPSFKTRTNRFESNNKQGPLYIIINKKDSNIKYQIHIESNQFKDASDNEVNKEQIFETMPEVKNMLFPFLNTPISKNNINNIIKQALKVSKFLPQEYLNVLFTKSTGILKDLSVDDLDFNNNNILINIFSNNQNIIVEDKRISKIKKHEKYISYEYISTIPIVKDYYLDLKQLYEKRFEPEDPDGTVLDYWIIHNGDFNENNIDLKQYLETYYKINEKELLKKFGEEAKTFGTFEKYVGDFYYNKINSIYYNLFYEHYENQYKNNIIEKYNECINISYLNQNNIFINKVNLFLFLYQNNINKIVDFNLFFKNFLDFNKLYNVGHYQAEFQPQNPPYDKIKDEINKIIINFNPECKSDLDKTYTIIKQYFINNTFDNDIVNIQIKQDWSDTFDCEKGIIVSYLNKENNSKFDGFVNHDKLIELLSTQPLNLKEDILKQFKRFL